MIMKNSTKIKVNQYEISLAFQIHFLNQNSQIMININKISKYLSSLFKVLHSIIKTHFH